MLTLDLDEKPGDPHERRMLTLDLDEKPGDPHLIQTVIVDGPLRRGQLNPERLHRRASGRRQQAHVVAGVGDMLLDDQAVLRVNRHLDIVADGHLAMGDHRACIRIGERDLPLATFLQLTEQRRTGLALFA
jgi:hypothetical protein